MLHAFNQLGHIQGLQHIKRETVEDTLPSSAFISSDTQYCTSLSIPIASWRHSFLDTHLKSEHFQVSSLWEAHSKEDTHQLSESSAMSHPFSSRRTPSRMLYASTETPDRNSMNDGQRVMQSQSFALPGTYAQPHGRMDIRPQSPTSSMTPTSSLSGAVGEMDIPPQLRNPATSSPYPTDPRAQLYWPSSHNISTIAPNIQPHIGSSSTTNPYNITPTTDLNTEVHHNQPTIPSRSSPFMHNYTGQMQFQQVRSPQNSPVPMMSRPASQMSTDQFRRPSQDSVEEENRQLRRKVKELELLNEQHLQHIKELEAQLASHIIDHPSQQPEASTSMIAPIVSGATPGPSSLEASWKARTIARTRLFCSLNRAGNALCSWHDSRRERRMYQPRMAPAGYLNCGCTFEEALFEESLSRHGVGSYRPGEAVRMDPALRNPLLKLLQGRYGYRDGDFERDPITGNWVDGEGNTLWEQKLLSASSSSKKKGEDRR